MVSLFYLDKRVGAQTFIQICDDSVYKMMLQLYEEKKEVVIYATKDDVLPLHKDDKEGGKEKEALEDDNPDNINYEEGSDYCHVEESYHSHHSDDDEEEELHLDLGYEGELYTYDKDNPKMEVGTIYPNVIAFRRALNHYAIIHDFEYNLEKSDMERVIARCTSLECSWRIHASVSKDGVTFEVRTTQSMHTCLGVNKRRN